MDYIGKQIGHYRILSLLGHGGFADVYLGEHVYLNTQAAIKVLHTQLAEEDVENFRNEASMIAHLVHPHIIRVLDFGVENATPFLVMDYAPHGTLRQLAAKGTRLSPMVFMPYVKQVASALQYAHDQKIIHRDVKPENMLLSHDGDVRLSDFGIAVVAQSSHSLETESVVLGTMLYMAPEQLQGKARPASDQYALGVVVYEWLSGVRPFSGSYMEIVTQHLSASPPPLDEQALSIPHAVTQVLFRALAKDQHQRFTRIQDFADALERAFRLKEPIAVGVAPTIVAPPPGISRKETSPPAPSTERVVTPAMPQEKIVPHSPQGQAAAPPHVEKPAQPINRSMQELKRGLGCTLRAVVMTLVIIPLLLCAVGFAGYNYLATRNPPSQATSLAKDFMNAFSNHNYDQAYNDLSSSITAGTSHDDFIKQAQSEDRCYGPVTDYNEASTSSPNGTQVHNYAVTRAKLAQPYHLHVTVTKDFFGNWHITDYNSDAGLNQSACH